MDYDETRALRTMLLAAVPHARVRMVDDDASEPAIGHVVGMADSPDDDLYRQLYEQAGDDVEVMVWVRWSRTYTRPEYVEDLVRVIDTASGGRS